MIRGVRFNGAGDPFLCRLFMDSERKGDFTEGALLEKTEQERVAIRFTQPGKSLIEVRLDSRPKRIGFSVLLHDESFLLAFAPAMLGAQRPRRHEPGCAKKPAGKNDTRSKTGGLAREQNEHRLGDLLGERRIAGDAPRGPEHERQMSIDQRAKCGFRTALGKFPQKLSVIHGLIGFYMCISTAVKYGTKKFLVPAFTVFRVNSIPVAVAMAPNSCH
jgi:hypothetical protein